MFRQEGGVSELLRGRWGGALTVSLFMKPQMAAATSHANRITKKKKNCGMAEVGDLFLFHPLRKDKSPSLIRSYVLKHKVLESSSL